MRNGSRPCHADVGRAGPPLCGGQRRGLRHRRQRQVCEPPALRDLARQGRVVGDRQRVDQRHPRRVARRACSAAAARTRQACSGQTVIEVVARRAHRAVRRSPAASRPNIPRLLLDDGRRCRTRPRRRWLRESPRRRRPSTPIVAGARQPSGAITVHMASGERDGRRFPPSRCRFASAARATRRW